MAVDLRQGLEDFDERSCCYNCNHYKSFKRGGICKLTEAKIKNAVQHTCTSHEETKLVTCEICDRQYRNIGLHVRAHGMTADQYRKKFGYNRTQTLSCEATSRMHAEPMLTEERRAQSRIDISKISRLRTKGYKFKLRPQALINLEKSRQNISPETRKKLSEASKGHTRNVGRVASDSARENMSKGAKRRLKYLDRKLVFDERGRIVTYTEKEKDSKKYERY
ncbi:hypothetical protein CEW46_23895 [Bacillus cereus]|nr:hypothetical protein CEW46_23895 [Bacillus cereus]